MKKFTAFILSILAFILSIVIILDAKTYLSACLKGLQIWALSVLPSLLPFFFLTTLITFLGQTEKLTRIFSPITKFLFKSKKITAYPFVMSLISGYPVGCKIIAELSSYGYIDESQATKASCFCSTSGPLFIVGAVGIGMFNSTHVAKILLLSHVLATVLCGFTFRFLPMVKSSETHVKTSLSVDNVLYETAYKTVVSVLVIGVFISVFYVLTQICINIKLFYLPAKLLAKFSISPQVSYAVFGGLLECTCGCSALANLPISKLNVSLACFLITFGGTSVLCQSYAFLKKANANFKIFLCGKLLQSVYSFIICYVIF